MRVLTMLATVAVLSFGFQFFSTNDVEAAGKKRISKNYCPPMTTRR